MAKAALYVRVSTVAQAEHGYSLETQIEMCKNKAKELGITSIEEYVDDGYSGEYIDRPAMDKLRNELKNKTISHVIVYDPDRLARNLSHQLIITEEIEKNNAKLVFVSVNFEQTPEGKLFYSLRGAVSEFEKAKIFERTNRGKKGKLKSGKMVSRLAVFGYDFDEITGGYKINETNAEIVRTMYQRFVEFDGGCLKFAHLLNSEGYRTPTDQLWGYSAVYRVLTCETYTGTFYGFKKYHKKIGQGVRKDIKRDKSEWIPVDVPVIIEKDLFLKVKEKLQKNRQNSNRRTKGEFLVRNILYCGKCGRKMLVFNGGDSTNWVTRYGCGSKRDTVTKKNCGSRMIRSDLVDETVWNDFIDICQSVENIEKYLSNKNIDKIDNSNEINRLKAEIDKLTKQRKAILNWMSDSLISEDEASIKLKDIKKKIDENNTMLDNLSCDKSQYRNPQEVHELFMSKYHNDMAFKERRELLLLLTKGIYIRRIDDNYGTTDMSLDISFELN